MPWHDILSGANTAMLVYLLTGMVRFHRDWAEMRLMVKTLWAEREEMRCRQSEK